MFSILVLAALSSQPFDLPLLAVQFVLILTNLLILLIIAVVLPLQLITDQRACTKSETTANGSSRAWMTDGATDNTSDRSTTEGADPSAFFPRRKWTARTAGTKQRDCDNQRQSFPEIVFHDLLPSGIHTDACTDISSIGVIKGLALLMSKQRTSPKRKKTEDSFNNYS
jgi:hypothetical protein